MSNKEILTLKIMTKEISIASPEEDKAGLIVAAEILNSKIASIPDKANALILASLDLAFQSTQQTSGEMVNPDLTHEIANLISHVDQSLQD